MIRHFYAVIEHENTNKTILIKANKQYLINSIISHINEITTPQTYAIQCLAKTAQKLKNKPTTKIVVCSIYSRKNYEKIDDAIQWLMS